MSTDAINAAKAGDRVIVQEISPPVYKLRDGLRAGDLVRLDHFDHGYWDVTRESDGLQTKIYMILIDRIVT